MQNILIIGGNFINKGAESMLKSTVAGIRERFPGYQPVLVDLFPTVKDEEKKNYDFPIVNMHVRTLFRISFPFPKLLFKSKPISDDEKQIKSLFKSAAAVFDISGYGLSSHNQPLLWSTAYLLPVRLARKYKVPVWLLPQSFGPFEFNGFKKLLFRVWGISLLNYPEVAFAREPSGLKALEKVRKRPSLLSHDIVLQTSEDIDLKAGEGALVIPNKQLFKIQESPKVLKLYADIIRQFLERGISVKVIRHSRDDLDFLQQLSGKVEHDLLTIDYSDWGLEALVKLIGEAQFVVTGRYHGAIHALKCGKPAVIIGWAEKYQTLARDFGLSQSLIDLRSSDSLSMAQSSVDFVINHAAELSKEINKKVSEVQKNSFWEKIELS